MSTGTQAVGSAGPSDSATSPFASGAEAPGVSNPDSLGNLGEYYKAAFLDVHALRFRETAALTQLLEQQRIAHERLLEEQRMMLSQEVTDWKQKAVRRFRALQAAKAEASEADARIAELQAECAALEVARSSDRAQLEKMRRSYSWKLTRPLRQLHSVYRRLNSR